MHIAETKLEKPFDVKIVLSNKKGAGILAYAEEKGYEAFVVPSKGIDREHYDSRLNDLLKNQDIDLIVLVGFMRILSQAFTHAWQNKIINVHPSLLPRHKGLMDLNVHQAVIDSKEKESGCTVHYVTEDVDGGPILMQLKCSVSDKETALSLKTKVQALEGEALFESISIIGNNHE